MSEFDNIKGYEGWMAKLDALIKESEEAIDADAQTRLAIKKRLAEFRKNSYPNNKKIKKLDEIAKKAGKAITASLLDERLASLKSRRKDLVALTKKFEAEAKANAKAAKKIKLENITGVLNSLTETAKALRKLKDSVESGDDATLTADIASAHATIEQLIAKFQGETTTTTTTTKKKKKKTKKKAKKSAKKKT